MANPPAPALKTIDPAAAEMIKRAEELGFSTVFSRAAKMAPCPIGAEGACCQMCNMGPCRLVPTKANPDPVGVCGATRATVAARNMARHVAAGTAAHSDHGRDLAFTLLAVAEDEAQGYEIRDPQKLRVVAGYMDVKTEKRTDKEIAKDVATAMIAEFGKQKGEVKYASRATKKRQELWRSLDLVPRGIDREVVDILHRTHMGDFARRSRRWLGGFDDGDGYVGHFVRHTIARRDPGQPGCVERRRSEHSRSRSRTHSVGDDRSRDDGTGNDRLRQIQGREWNQPCRCLLYIERSLDAPGHSERRQRLESGTRVDDRRRRNDGGRCAVHHASAV